jgi:hypothetical protein
MKAKREAGEAPSEPADVVPTPRRPSRKRRWRHGRDGPTHRDGRIMSAEDKIEDSSAPLIEHLAELRTRLIRSVLAFVVAMVACFTVAQPILNFIQQPLPTCWSPAARSPS